MRVIGIDPGLRITGYGLLEGAAGTKPLIREAGIIRTTDAKTTNLTTRLEMIFNGVTEVLTQYKPEVMAIEQLYSHYAHPRTSILMGHARGVILLAATILKLPVIHYSATSIKKTITGSGRASKDQMQVTIQRELNLDRLPEPPDVADALAVALCHYYHMKFKF